MSGSLVPISATPQALREDGGGSASTPIIPLAGVADAMLARLAAMTGAREIAALDGATLLGERAAIMGLNIAGRISAGGGCRLYDARDDAIALNLARPSDRALLPALFEDDAIDAWDDAAIAARIAGRDPRELLARGREMGLAMARLREQPPPASLSLPSGPAAGPVPARDARKPRILDLSALWAGPLAAHLLWLAGADVVKVESRTRPDAMRDGAPDFFALLNQGKANVALDLGNASDRAALLALIAGADIVIEAARPRALLQLGIDADALVRARPALFWITITGHGMTGDAANWVGFGDDCGVAGGLGAALKAASGATGFVGDAIADPLTGIAAAETAWRAWTEGRGGRYGIAMAQVVAAAIATARTCDATGFDAGLRAWAKAVGRPFPAPGRRMTRAAVRPFGADRPDWRC